MIPGRVLFRPACRYAFAPAAAPPTLCATRVLRQGLAAGATHHGGVARTIRRWESTASATSATSSTQGTADTAASTDTAGTTGSDKTGHIEAGPNESILFFDSESSCCISALPNSLPVLTFSLDLFPLKLSSLLLWRSWDTGELLKRFDSARMSFLDPMSLVKRAIPENGSVKVVEFYPRLKEGGIYVKFTSPSGTSPAEVEGTNALQSVCSGSSCPGHRPC